MQGVLGPVLRLRTRSMCECLLTRAGWAVPVREIVFLKENVATLNGRDLCIVEQYSGIVYSDALIFCKYIRH